MFLKFEYYGLAISEVSHYEFLRGHLVNFNKLTKRSYDWSQ
jgi:hypothetical protein